MVAAAYSPAWSVHSPDARLYLAAVHSCAAVDLSVLITIYGALFMQQKSHKSPLVAAKDDVNLSSVPGNRWRKRRRTAIGASGILLQMR